MTGILTGGAGLGTILGLLFFKSQRYIQKASNSLALANMISTVNNYSFSMLGTLMYNKYVHTPQEDAMFPSINNKDYMEILNSLKDLTIVYSTELYEKTKLIDERYENEDKPKADKSSD